MLVLCFFFLILTQYTIVWILDVDNIYFNVSFSFCRTDSEGLETATTMPPDKAGTLQILFHFSHVVGYSFVTQQFFNPVRTKLYLSDLRNPIVPRSKRSASVIKNDKLMLYREIIAVCSEIHTKHINALWAKHRISEC